MPSCVEMGTCTIGGNFWDYLLTPLTLQLGDWLTVIIWGIVILMMHIYVKNTMLTGLVGAVIASYLVSKSVATVAAQAFLVGFVLLAVSIGFILYRAYKQT